MKITKKFVSLIAAASLAIAALTTVSADDDIKVTLNGSEISFDVAPRLMSDITMVPLRAIFEAMGADVDWDEPTLTVTAVKDGTTVKMTIGVYEISVNGKPITLEVAPVQIDDRTLVPVRAVAESFGALVDWDDANQTVIIKTDTPAAVTPAPTEAPTAAPTAAPTEKPADSGAIPIEYDVDSTTSDSVKSFKIESCTVEPNGDYNIKFSFRTFLEGPGSVDASFNCLDDSGKVIATIGGMYKTVDYEFTPHTDSAIIPAATKRIVLAGK